MKFKPGTRVRLIRRVKTLCPSDKDISRVGTVIPSVREGKVRLIWDGTRTPATYYEIMIEIASQ